MLCCEACCEARFEARFEAHFEARFEACCEALSIKGCCNNEKRCKRNSRPIWRKKEKRTSKTHL